MCNNNSTFVIAIPFTMTTKLIKIGNSRGIVIPSSVLKKLGLKEKDDLMIQIQDGQLVLTVIKEEFSGPFTGPFAPLARFAPDEDDKRDALEIAQELHDSRVDTREIPQW